MPVWFSLDLFSFLLKCRLETTGYFWANESASKEHQVSVFSLMISDAGDTRSESSRALRSWEVVSPNIELTSHLVPSHKWNCQQIVEQTALNVVRIQERRCSVELYRLKRLTGRLYDKSAKVKSVNDTSAKPTVQMPIVRKGQRCDWDKSVNIIRANVSSAVQRRCEKSATTMWTSTVRIAFLFSNQNYWYWFRIWTERKKREPAKRLGKGTLLICCPTRTDILFQYFFMHTFNTLASRFVYMNGLIQEEKGKGTAGVCPYTRQMVGVIQDAGSQLRHEKKAKLLPWPRRERFAMHHVKKESMVRGRKKTYARAALTCVLEY